MTPTVMMRLDDYIEAYEAALAQGHQADLQDFLPDAADPLYQPVLCELIRIDLEHGWENGTPKPVEEYQAQFPDLFGDPSIVVQLAFEEFRLRRQAGERPTREEYQQRFGVALKDTESENISPSRSDASHLVGKVALPAEQPSLGACLKSSSTELAQIAHQFQRIRREGTQNFASWCRSYHNNIHVDLFREIHASDPSTAEQLARAITAFPEVGREFLGFQLIQELGQGAFGRVYLAQQSGLANRHVALKVSTDLFHESQALAQLQHTNIVPIYSVHKAPPFQAVCMPYFGSATLRDVLDDLQRRDSLPASGKGLVSTINDRKSATSLDRRHDERTSVMDDSVLTERANQPEPKPAAVLSVPKDASTVTLKMLGNLSYVEAVLWVGTKVVEGLAHAHERGILHRDLKPANILLTDEAQPMLLDFNLSQDTKQHATASAASIGGTLPYMAPEHLEAFQKRSRKVDARSDLYSLGIILFELLTGHHPFPDRRGAIRSVLPHMIEDRLGSPPRLRQFNKVVTPAVESIVRKCLEPDPSRRYQTARQMLEDLDRHQRHLPLRYAPEPSLKERAHKWVRAHPRLTSWTTLGAVVCLVVVASLTAVAVRERHVESLEALSRLDEFGPQMREAQFLLYGRTAERDQVEQGLAKCRQALGQYQVLENPSWLEIPAVHNLPADRQDQLKANVGELLFLSARAASLRAGFETNAKDRREHLRAALEWNQEASRCYDRDRTPKALWQQRGELLVCLGNQNAGNRLFSRANQTPVRTPQDYYLLAHLYAKEGNYRKALPLLEEATRRDPENFSAWFVKANCHDSLLQDVDAISCYSACIALRPDFHWVWYNRGLAYYRHGRYDQARADFDQAIKLKPDLPDVYLSRGLAEEQLSLLPEAIQDYTRALDHGSPKTQIFFLRAVVREKAGDHKGAEQDRQEGLRRTPTDEASFVARGLARLERDARGALSDFEAALRLNPLSFAALEDKAHVLGERYGKNAEAVRVLDHAVELYPDSVLPRAGRGVHLARLGKTEAALADAQAALLLDTEPQTLYQVACIYALTSPTVPKNRLRAFELLSWALTAGFGWDVVEKDPDLEPIRKCEEFQRVVNAARAMQRR